VTPETDPYMRALLDLRSQITDGRLPEGERLLSVRAIADLYSIERNQAERVVTELRNAGLVTTRRGSGTFVRKFAAIPRSSPGRLARERWLGGETIQDADTSDRRRELDTQTGETAAPGWAAEVLGIEAGTPVAFRDRRYAVDDRYVQLSTSYLPIEIARGTPIMHTNTGPGGTYARLAELGFEPAYFREYVRARMPLPAETDRLELPAGTPVLEVTRHAYASTGRCVEVSRMILDGMAYLLDYSFPA
jgi:GntR family transcriptional regulator